LKIKNIKSLVLLTLTTIIAGTTLTGCGGGSTSASSGSYSNGTVNIFNWSEYIPDTTIKAFETKYHIKVNYTTYASNEEMLAKVQASKGQYDLAVASDYMVDSMKKQNLLETVDMANVSNFKNIGSKFKNLAFDLGNKYSVPYTWGDAVIVVNTKKFKGDITSYSDLWNSKFKSSMVVLDDERALIGIALKKLGYSMNETDPTKLAQAQAELIKLKPNITAFDSDSPKTKLINGDASVGYVWSAEAYLAEKQNKDLKTFVPKEGVYLWQDNFVIPNGAKNKKNAELFINYILDANVDAAIAKSFPYSSPNEAAYNYIDKSILNNTTAYPTNGVIKNGEHLKDVGNSLKIFDQVWTEFKQSN